MGLLGKKICAGCGKETGIMSFTFKADKQHLCKHCVAKLPVDDIKAYAKKNWTADYFKNTFLPFLEESEERRKNFKLKAWYGALFIDEKNEMFCYSDFMAFVKTKEIPEYTPIIKFDDLSQDSTIYFESTDTKEGVFGYSVKGDVKLRLNCNYPELHFEGTLKSDLAIRVKKKKNYYTLPEDLKKVRDLFNRLLGVIELDIGEDEQ